VFCASNCELKWYWRNGQ